MSNPTLYESLFAEALADVESGLKHPCKLTQDCQEARGCPRCISGVMRGDLGVLHVDVFESGTIRITTTGHDGERCTVAFRGVPVTVHQDRRNYVKDSMNVRAIVRSSLRT